MRGIANKHGVLVLAGLGFYLQRLPMKDTPIILWHRVERRAQLALEVFKFLLEILSFVGALAWRFCD